MHLPLLFHVVHVPGHQHLVLLVPSSEHTVGIRLWRSGLTLGLVNDGPLVLELVDILNVLGVKFGFIHWFELFEPIVRHNPFRYPIRVAVQPRQRLQVPIESWHENITVGFSGRFDFIWVAEGLLDVESLLIPVSHKRLMWIAIASLSHK